jgi:hypothetical protein
MVPNQFTRPPRRTHHETHQRSNHPHLCLSPPRYQLQPRQRRTHQQQSQRPRPRTRVHRLRLRPSISKLPLTPSGRRHGNETQWHRSRHHQEVWTLVLGYIPHVHPRTNWSVLQRSLQENVNTHPLPQHCRANITRTCPTTRSVSINRYHHNKIKTDKPKIKTTTQQQHLLNNQPDLANT